MNPRFDALKKIGRFHTGVKQVEKTINSENFGKRTFSRSLMQKILPREVYKNILSGIEGSEKIKPEYADIIAVAVKEWAMSHGATHYCHWFQPLTGASAEKHDSFIEWDHSDKVIENFNGKQLIQGEPDASSFPSGGLRSTYEARGYTGWDPSSPIFLWRAGDGITLCIPSVFFSWTGNVLDSKIPVLRSDQIINKAASRLLRLIGIDARYVFSTLGLEQEYFIVDRSLRNLRPDLVLLGKTVFGAHSPKGQELQDHYFGSVKDRILSFMCDFEAAAIELGIPVKTRHNEVAPNQFEVAPVFEKSSTAIDHNIILMEIMRQVAQRHQFSCLLHEKPFAAINGSGKHANWSLSTDSGLNLLDPTDNPNNNWRFLVLLTAILHGVHKHAALLRASIGSASNDYRLGGHEAPPAIMSVYLGQGLENVLNSIEEKGSSAGSFVKDKYDLGLLIIPDLSKDNTDRNRTSPFAFTGNKFEFRAVGSSSNPSFPATVLNSIVAESLNEMLDEIESRLTHSDEGDREMGAAILPVLQKYLRSSKGIRFSGDNYSPAWVKEAESRGLPNIKKSSGAFPALTDPKTIKLFEHVLTKEELASRRDILFEHYVYNMNIEVNLMLELFKTHIFPAALHFQSLLAGSYLVCENLLKLDQEKSLQFQNVRKFNELIEQGMQCSQELEEVRDRSGALSMQEKADHYACEVSVKMERLRKVADEIEKRVEDSSWPLPKYRELLFLV